MAMIWTCVEGAADFVSADRQDLSSGRLAGIDANSVCSTSSDQDPTLPETPARHLREQATRGRRPSIAVWSDPTLLAVANAKVREISPPPSRPSVSPVSPAIPTTTTDRLTSVDPALLARILNYLDLASLVQFSLASRYCKLFVDADERVLQTMDLSPFNTRMADDVLASLSRLVSGRTRALCLAKCYHLTDQSIIQLVGQASNLESLDLNSCWLLTNKSLQAIADSCSQLKHLNLSNCRKVTDAGMALALPHLSHLETLNLSYCKNLTYQTMQTLAMYNATTLQRLTLQRCTKINDGAFEMWADTAHFNALAAIDLTDCSFLSDKAIVALIVAAPNLEQIKINFCCALSDTAVEEMARRLQHLQVLDCSFCGAAVSDASVATLLRERAATLARLSLRGCVRITGTGIMQAMEPSHLQYLNVSQCPGVSAQVKNCISGHIRQLVT